jgi:hypothetical protein
MAIHEIQFQSDQTLVWSWPLEIGLFDPDGVHTGQLNHFQYIQQLSRIHPLPLSSGYLNLLVFPEGLEQAAMALDNKWALIGEQPGVIIVLEPSKSTQPAEAINPASHLQVLKDGAQEQGVAGIFHIEWTQGPGRFLDHLLVELSHNNSLPVALKQMGAQGFYCYDKKLLRETKLSHVMNSLIQALNTFMPDRMLQLESHLLRGKADLTGKALAKFLKKEAPSYRFDSERGEATGLVQITTTLYQEMPQPAFNIGNEHFQWAMSGPAESAPPDAFETEGESSVADAPTRGGIDRGVDKPLAEFSDSWADGGEISKPKPPPKKSSSKPSKKIKTTSFLQARLTSKAQPDEPVINYLIPHRIYKLHVRIGSKDNQWLQGKPAFPKDVVFVDPNSKEETLLITYKDNFSEKVQSGSLILHREGNTGELIFTLKAGNTGVPLEGHVSVFHLDRLIQEGVVRAGVYTDKKAPAKPEPIVFEITVCIRQQLDNASERTPFGASIQVEEKGNNKAGFTGVSNNKPLPINYTTGLATLISEIKAEIEQAVVNIDDYPEDLFAENNVNLLHFLAYKGNDLYLSLLHADPNIRGPVQIVSNRDEFLPLDFVYTLPPPTMDATLCAHAREALEAGSCRNCYDKSQNPAPCFCPFGFWGFSQVIERHNIIPAGIDGPIDFNLLAEPSAGRSEIQLLGNTLYAASDRVEAAQPGLLDQVATSIKNSTAALSEAADWDDWDKKVKQQPDSLVLVVHIEKHAVLKVEQLEIGDKKFLPKNLLNHSKLKGADGSPPPFVVIIGCEPNNVANHGFDIAAQLMHQGAAIVLTNFTKIRGRQAGPIVMRLMAFIKSFKGKELRFGEIVLKLRQHLLAQGIMAGMSLVAYGDADWKIKI